MTVAKFQIPNYTTDTAAQYKGKIDGNAAVVQRLAGAFAPHAQDTPDMTVRLDAGALLLGAGLTEVAAQSTGTITAPASNPRIDRVVIDSSTGAVSVITGTEAASPTAPALTAGKLPICQVALTTSTTSITNSMITDERVGSALPIPVPVDAGGTGGESLSEAQLNLGIAGIPSFQNLRVANDGSLPSQKIVVTADEAILRRASDDLLRRFTGVNVSADITSSGAGGLDTGTEATDTWYYIWLIAKEDGTKAALLSASSSSPTLDTGYVYKALVGAVYNDYSGAFRQFHQYGDKVVYDDPMYSSAPTVSASEATWGAFTTFTPPVAKSQILRIQTVLKEATTGTWEGLFFLGVRSGHYIVQIYRKALGLYTGSYFYDRDNEYEIPYVSGSLYYYMQGGTTNFYQVTIFNIGFRMPILAS